MQKFMTLQDKLIDCLTQKKDQYQSGEALARQFQVSRAAVWKTIQGLRAAGFIIDSVPNRGYRLQKDPRPVTLQGIESYLRHKAFYSLSLQHEVDSTNTRAKALGAAGEPEGHVVIALSQTGGKGRRGRGFYSPYGSGVYFSILLRPDFTARQALLITTAAAVAVAEAIERAGSPAAIKWVNDVFVNGHKVCGILTEAAADLETGGLEYAALGIGLNVAPPSGGFPPALAGIAGSIFEKFPGAAVIDRLVADVLDGFYELYQDLEPERFWQRYNRRSLLTGRPVQLTTSAGTKTVTVEGIDKTFRLLVRDEQGTVQAVSSGEATVGSGNI